MASFSDQCPAGSHGFDEECGNGTCSNINGCSSYNCVEQVKQLNACLTNALCGCIVTIPPALPTNATPGPPLTLCQQCQQSGTGQDCPGCPDIPPATRGVSEHFQLFPFTPIY